MDELNIHVNFGKELFHDVKEKYESYLESSGVDYSTEVRLYFGFDEEQSTTTNNNVFPSLKSHIKEATGRSISGKRLYLLFRKLDQGEHLVFKRSPFKKVFFEYLGFRDINDYIERAKTLPVTVANQQLSWMAFQGIEVNEEQQQSLLELIEKLVGEYFCWHKGDSDRLIQSSLTINSGGKLIATGPSSGDKTKSYFGTVTHFEDENIHCHFEDENKKVAHLIVYTGKAIFPEALSGVFSHVNFNGVPSAKRMVLVRKTGYNQESFTQKVQQIYRMDDEYIKLESRFKISSFLIGRSGNEIETPRSTSLSDLVSHSNIGEVFFYASLYWYDKDVVKARSYLKQASENGYYNIPSLDDMISKLGCITNDPKVKSFLSCLESCRAKAGKIETAEIPFDQ